MIMGGLVDCNDSVRSIKRSQRETIAAVKWASTSDVSDRPDKEITSSERDNSDIAFPHNDPLVVELLIADCECLKFPCPSGTKTIRGDQRVARSCFIAELKIRKSCAIVRDEKANAEVYRTKTTDEEIRIHTVESTKPGSVKTQYNETTSKEAQNSIKLYK
ncbi:unnamed protein product [Cochlearia groenlandica]